MLRALLTLAFISASMAITCEEARMRCAFRTGCGTALQGYILGCATVLQDTPSYECPEECQNALVALSSTPEGNDLMTCTCANEACNETKQRMEICRPQVTKQANKEQVTCNLAQWICAADATCGKALEFYHGYCLGMFKGKRCTRRCRNSINILRKQEKAAKLESCLCSGNEEFDCPQIRVNMAKLCYNQTIPLPPIVGADGEPTTTISYDDNNNVYGSATGLFAITQLSYLCALVPLIVNNYLRHWHLLS